MRRPCYEVGDRVTIENGEVAEVVDYKGVHNITLRYSGGNILTTKSKIENGTVLKKGRQYYATGTKVEIDNGEIATVSEYIGVNCIMLKTSKGVVKTTKSLIESKEVFSGKCSRRNTSKYVGHKYKTVEGYTVECIDRTGNYVTVRYDDGTKVNVTITRLASGNIIKPLKENKVVERITGIGNMMSKICKGTQVINSDGQVLECLYIREDDTIDVLIKSRSMVRIGVKKRTFLEGTVPISIDDRCMAMSYFLYKKLSPEMVDALTDQRALSLAQKDNKVNRVRIEDYRYDGNSDISPKESLESKKLKKNKKGYLMGVVKYNSSKDVDVAFPEKNTVRLGVYASQFHDGSLSCEPREGTPVKSLDDYFNDEYPYKEDTNIPVGKVLEYDTSVRVTEEGIRYMGVVRNLGFNDKAKIYWYRNILDVDIVFLPSLCRLNHCDIYTFRYGNLEPKNSPFDEKIGLARVYKDSELDNPWLALKAMERIELRKKGVRYAYDLVFLAPEDINAIKGDGIDNNKILFLRKCLMYKFGNGDK